jgi:hypothetical protein
MVHLDGVDAGFLNIVRCILLGETDAQVDLVGDLLRQLEGQSDLAAIEIIEPVGYPIRHYFLFLINPLKIQPTAS